MKTPTPSARPITRFSASWNLTGRRIAVALLATSFPSLVQAADFTSTYSGVSGNWNVGANWTTPGTPATFPDNGAFTYDAILANGATVTLAIDIDINAFALSSGTLTGSSNLTLAENLIWTGGTMSGSGTTSVAGGASTISGTGQKILGRMLTNTGTITFSTPDSNPGLYFGDTPTAAGVLNNAVGGVFNVTAGGDFNLFNSNAAHAINNAGTWNVSGVGTTSNVSSIALNNTGSVNVSSGTMALSGGGTSTGSFAVSAGAVLRFDGGTHHLNAGSSVSGAGTVDFNGGIVNVGGSYAGNVLITGGTGNFNTATAPSSITMTSGTLAGTAAVGAAGDLAWTGGVMTGAGTTNVAGAGSTISGTGQKILGRMLTNTGTITFSTPDSNPGLYFGDTPTAAGVLNNAVGGVFNVTAGGDFNLFNSNAAHAINNAGTWNVSGVATTSNVNAGITFNNTGAVNVNSGTFTLRGVVSQYSFFALNAGIWRVFAGARLNLPAIGFGVITNRGDITLSGAGSDLRAGSPAESIEFTLTTNIGALRVLGNRDYFSTGAFTNSGVFELGGGEFLATGFTNTATGLISGTGTIVPNVSNAGTIAPGFSAGALNIEFDLTLASTSVLSLEVGGLAQGTQYDLLSEGGSVALNLNGSLSVSLINGFVPDSAALFTVVSSNQNLNGAFLNIANGARLFASGGGSFQVNYGTGSVFAQNAVVLSNYVVPEPGITGLLAAAALWVFGNRGRRWGKEGAPKRCVGRS